MDLWKYLAGCQKTVVMYGMGNGADKILAVCEKYNIEVADFFASDGFVRGQQFHGKTVLSFSDVKSKYGANNIIVLVSFASSLQEVMNNIIKVASECETYVPDVPVRGSNVFCEEFENENRKKIEKAFALLADERSREVFSGVLEFRRTGRLDILLQTADDRLAVMNELLRHDKYRIAADVGAYDGDTARELTELCPKIESIIAFEPDRRNCRKLSAYAESEPRIQVINAAAWNESTTLVFDDSGNRNAGLDEDGSAKRHAEVRAITLDSVLTKGADYIKYDVEGAEKQAIEGTAETIRKYHPDLLISAYHRTEDLHELILQVNSLAPEYKLYLRRYPYIPAWDLNLYAILK